MCFRFIATDLVDTIGVFIRSEFYIPNSIDLFATKAKDKYLFRAGAMLCLYFTLKKYPRRFCVFC